MRGTRPCSAITSTSPARSTRGVEVLAVAAEVDAGQHDLLEAARRERLAARRAPRAARGCGCAPRAIGTMQKVQKRSQPSCTLRKARVWPGERPRAEGRDRALAAAVADDARAAPAPVAVTAATSASRRFEADRRGRPPSTRRRLARLRLRVAAGQDDARRRVVAPRAARQPPALGVGGVGHRAGVDDHDVRRRVRRRPASQPARAQALAIVAVSYAFTLQPSVAIATRGPAHASAPRDPAAAEHAVAVVEDRRLPRRHRRPGRRRRRRAPRRPSAPCSARRRRADGGAGCGRATRRPGGRRRAARPRRRRAPTSPRARSRPRADHAHRAGRRRRARARSAAAPPPSPRPRRWPTVKRWTPSWRAERRARPRRRSAPAGAPPAARARSTKPAASPSGTKHTSMLSGLSATGRPSARRLGAHLGLGQLADGKERPRRARRASSAKRKYVWSFAASTAARRHGASRRRVARRCARSGRSRGARRRARARAPRAGRTSRAGCSARTGSASARRGTRRRTARRRARANASRKSMT